MITVVAEQKMDETTFFETKEIEIMGILQGGMIKEDNRNVTLKTVILRDKVNAMVFSIKDHAVGVIVGLIHYIDCYHRAYHGNSSKKILLTNWGRMIFDGVFMFGNAENSGRKGRKGGINLLILIIIIGTIMVEKSEILNGINLLKMNTCVAMKILTGIMILIPSTNATGMV